MTTTLHFLPMLRGLLLGLLLLLAGVAQAQHDVILRADGEEIPAKVLVIGPNNIHYVVQGPAAPDTLTIPTAQVFLIRYANGTKEVIKQTPVAAPQLTRAQAEQRGTDDARKYFRAPGAFWATYGTTVAYFPVGIVTGGVMALVKPSPANLVVPQPELRQNPDYMRAYQEQAQRKKIGRAAAGFGAGVATLAVAVVVLLSQTTHW